MRPRTVDRVFDTLSIDIRFPRLMATVKQRTPLGITCHYRTTILKLETQLADTVSDLRNKKKK
jgi:hypothetical protein